jgi:hypothetical protein
MVITVRRFLFSMQPYFYADDFEKPFAPADKKVRPGLS